MIWVWRPSFQSWGLFYICRWYYCKHSIKGDALHALTLSHRFVSSWKHTCPSARGLPSAVQTPFPYTFINRNHGSSQSHSGKLIRTGISGHSLSIFLTIIGTLVNHAFKSCAIIFDPGWSNFLPPASSVYVLLTLQETTHLIHLGIPETLPFLSCWQPIYDDMCLFFYSAIPTEQYLFLKLVCPCILFALCAVKLTQPLHSVLGFYL